MNRELIKKYKTEFNYWLNGGSLVLGQEKPDNSFEWVLPTTVSWNNPSCIYIINDEYAELRKAIAEGKTIQYSPLTQTHNRWDDIKPYPSMFTSPVKNFRVKPEEPKFKVGDWVRNVISNKITQVKNEDIVNGKYSEVELWKPEPGEWCLFYSSTEPERVTLAQFSHMREAGETCGYSYPYEIADGGWFENCEPFIGELPAQLLFYNT
jgi:hypothetical protein